MGNTDVLQRPTSNNQQGELFYAPVAASCSVGLKDAEKLSALPGFHLINDVVIAFKQGVDNGQRGVNVSKACCYLGYRVVTYLCLPLAFNLISLVGSLVLTLLTLPTRFCGSNQLNRWCWVRLQGSLAFTLQSLYDLTGDIRQASRCCCTKNSFFLAI